MDKRVAASDSPVLLVEPEIASTRDSSPSKISKKGSHRRSSSRYKKGVRDELVRFSKAKASKSEKKGKNYNPEIVLQRVYNLPEAQEHHWSSLHRVPQELLGLIPNKRYSFDQKAKCHVLNNMSRAN